MLYLLRFCKVKDHLIQTPGEDTSAENYTWQLNSCPQQESPTEALYPQNGPTARSWSLQCTPKEPGLPRDSVGPLVVASASIPRGLKWVSDFKENLCTPFGNLIQSLIIQQPKAAH